MLVTLHSFNPFVYLEEQILARENFSPSFDLSQSNLGVKYLLQTFAYFCLCETGYLNSENRHIMKMPLDIFQMGGTLGRRKRGIGVIYLLDFPVGHFSLL